MPTRKILNIGSFANDGTGDTLRDAADKINYNFSHLYSNVEVNSISGTSIINDGSEVGEIKYLVNQNSSPVNVTGLILGGSQMTLSGSSACQVIWTGTAWALISGNSVSIT